MPAVSDSGVARGAPVATPKKVHGNGQIPSLLANLAC